MISFVLNLSMKQSFYANTLAVVLFAGVGSAAFKSCTKNADTVIKTVDDVPASTPPPPWCVPAFVE